MGIENKVRTTLNLDKDIMKGIKVVALNKNTTQTEIISEYLKKGLKAEESKNKIPNYLIANKETYKPNIKRKKKMAGIIKTKKSFDAIEIVRDSRRDE